MRGRVICTTTLATCMMADLVVECIVRAVEEQGRRRKSVKSLWVRPVAVGVMLVLLAYWVRGVDADLSEAAAMNERIDTLAQEKAILSEEIAEAKNIARALRHEVDLLAKKHRDETVPKTHVSVAALRREIEQLRESIQDYKNDVEALKQQLKRKQGEAALQSENETLRQELIDLLRDKQSKKDFLVEITWIKQKMDAIKENEAALKQNISGLVEKQQICMAEVVQLRQEVESLKQTQDSESLIQNAAVKEHEVLIIQLTKKQETDREHLVREIAELWERQELVRTVRPEINHLRQSDQVLRKEIETMKQLNQNYQQETEELILRHQNDTQTELTKLPDFYSQNSSAIHVEMKVGNIAQQGLSAGSVWRLVVVLWMTFYLFLYHQKFRNRTQGMIHELIEKQDTDREFLKGNRDAKRGVVSDSLRTEVDKLKEAGVR